MASSKALHPVSTLLQIAVTGGIAGWECADLYAHHVPLALIAACGMGVWSSLFGLCHRIAEAAATTTYRCTERGCDFTVRLRTTSPAESRRWQETAAAHPHRS